MADEENELHKQFIEALPEDLRENAPQYVEHWDKYVQEQFGDRAEQIKAYEPYSQINVGTEAEPQIVDIKSVPPEELAELLAFRDMASNEQKFDAWLDEIIEKREEVRGVPPVSDEYADPEIEALRREVADLRTWRESETAAQATRRQEEEAAQAAQWVDGQIEAIKKDHPSLTDEQIDAICALAAKYPPSDDIVQKGFEDFKKLVGGVESDFFDRKVNQPTPAVHGGSANTAAEKVTSYEDAGEAAKARVRQALRGG